MRRRIRVVEVTSPIQTLQHIAIADEEFTASDKQKEVLLGYCISWKR